MGKIVGWIPPRPVKPDEAENKGKSDKGEEQKPKA